MAAAAGRTTGFSVADLQDQNIGALLTLTLTVPQAGGIWA